LNTYHETTGVVDPVRVNNVFQLNTAQLVGVSNVTDTGGAGIVIV
jgi:hypothetical protein